MSDQMTQQAAAMPMVDARAAKWPREIVTLSLVAFCLSFWSIVILAIARMG